MLMCSLNCTICNLMVYIFFDLSYHMWHVFSVIQFEVDAIIVYVYYITYCMVMSDSWGVLIIIINVEFLVSSLSNNLSIYDLYKCWISYLYQRELVLTWLLRWVDKETLIYHAIDTRISTHGYISSNKLILISLVIIMVYHTWCTWSTIAFTCVFLTSLWNFLFRN